MYVSFTRAIVHGFSNYVNFTGRSSRSEYWWWFLFTFLIGLVLSAARIILLLPAIAANRALPAAPSEEDQLRNWLNQGITGQSILPTPASVMHYDIPMGPSLIVAIVSAVLGLILLLPTLSLYIRRLRDAGHRWTTILLPYLGQLLMAFGLVMTFLGFLSGFATAVGGTSSTGSGTQIAGLGVIVFLVGFALWVILEIVLLVFRLQSSRDDPRFLMSEATYNHY